MQKVLVISVGEKGYEALHKELTDGWRVIVATPVLEESYKGGSYTTSIVYILEK